MYYLPTTPNHPTSPLGDSRERAVPCAICRRATFNYCACCNTHCTHAAESAALEAADAMLAQVDDRMAEFDATFPVLTELATPEAAKDIKATAGMVRLLADITRESPASSSAWQMLASALAALQVKTRALQ